MKPMTPKTTAMIRVGLVLFLLIPVFAHAQKQSPHPKSGKLKRVYKTEPVSAEQGAKYFHAPFVQQDCSICHVRADKKDPGGMKAPTQKLCLACHVPSAHMLKSNKFIHEPTAKDCTYCHNPHSSAVKQLLYEPTKKLCDKCHHDAVFGFGAKSKHRAILRDNGCITCHSPHAADEKSLLLSPYMCSKCHDEDGVKDENGKALTNFRKLRQAGKFQHKPFKENDCVACHRPHTSKYRRLLSGAYPDDFYAEYSDAAYALCYRCHKSERVSEKETETLTGFRDGKQNLHYVHVASQDGNRSCESCHEAHATQWPHLVRDSVPYGTEGWHLPITFAVNPTGGTCTKTCHDTKSYDNGGHRPSNIGDIRKVTPKREIAAKTDAERTRERGEIDLSYAARMLKRRRWDQALELATQAIAKDGASAEAHAVAAAVYAEKRNCEAADKEIKNALDINPKNKLAKKAAVRVETHRKKNQCVDNAPATAPSDGFQPKTSTENTVP